MKRTVAALVLVLAGCGELAVDGAYHGESLFDLSGTVRLEPSALAGDISGELRAALFWANLGEAGTQRLATFGAVEHEVDATTSFPARFTLTVRTPPDDSLLGTTADVGGRYGVAMVLVYLDENSDQRWNRDRETLVGAAADTVLVYAPDGLTGGRFGALAPGFHLLQVPPDGGCGGAAVTPADAGAVTIHVYGEHPERALVDLDCDGVSQEWSGTCPDLAAVFESCRTQDDVEGSVCETCEYLLWDDDAGEDECEEWREHCEELTDPEECERAVGRCHEGPS